MELTKNRAYDGPFRLHRWGQDESTSGSELDAECTALVKDFQANTKPSRPQRIRIMFTFNRDKSIKHVILVQDASLHIELFAARALAAWPRNF